MQKLIQYIILIIICTHTCTERQHNTELFRDHALNRGTLEGNGRKFIGRFKLFVNTRSGS